MHHEETQTAGQQTPPSSAEPSAEREQAAGSEMTHEQLLLTLEDARAKADQHWNQLLLVKAEAENSRRRAERDAEASRKYALEKIIKDLLPVVDSLELGLAAAGTDAATEKLREGVALTLKMLGGVLERFEVQAIDPKGGRFNPEHHQAMAMQEVAGVEANTVLTVYQKGYLLHDRLLRPAMVVVAAAPREQTASGVDERA